MQYAKYLSEEIGPRAAGTEKEYEAASYLCRCFAKLGLHALMQPFTFLNWLPLATPYLEVLTPEPMRIPLAPMSYTLSSDASGVCGVVRKAAGKMVLVPNYKEWEKYVIADDGREVGFFVKNPAGEASPFPTSRPMLPEVGAIMGKDDAERFDAWLAEGRTVRVRLHSSCMLGPARSQNVVAMIGDGPPEIVVSAHYDSAHYAPGAVDNGSGIQVMIELAAELAGRRNLPTIAFVAMGCEEPGMLGSYHYLYDLQERGAIRQVRACVNFDMLGSGEWIMLRVGSGLAAMAEAVRQEVADRLSHPVKTEYAMPVSDNWPFETAGIPNIHFVAQPFTLYHMPKDTMQVYDASLAEDVKLLGRTLLERLIDGAPGEIRHG